MGRWSKMMSVSSAIRIEIGKSVSYRSHMKKPKERDVGEEGVNVSDMGNAVDR